MTRTITTETETTLQVLIYSGGLDSTTLLYHLLLSHEHNNININNLYLLNFNYGQKHIKEQEYARRNISDLKIPRSHFIQIDLSNLKNIFVSSSLTNKKLAIPFLSKLEKEEKEKSLKQTVVPARNAIFLTIASSFADSIIRSKKKYTSANIYYAAHMSDYGVYPDCRPEFVEAINETIQLATADDNNNNKNKEKRRIRIEAPFINLTKSHIVSIGSRYLDLGSKTWSCYKGLYNHCGECSSCRERKLAFQIAKVQDTTEYGEAIEFEKAKTTFVH